MKKGESNSCPRAEAATSEKKRKRDVESEGRNVPLSKEKMSGSKKGEKGKVGEGGREGDSERKGGGGR